MTRSPHFVRALLAATSLVVLLAAAGCGDSPTAPSISDPGAVYVPSGGPKILQVRDDGSADWVEIPSALRGPTPLPGPDPISFDPTRVLTVSKRIDGAVGGRLVCGRFVATLPPGAFVGTGVVSMTVPDSTLMLCDLEVTPAELNHFLLPVDLSLRTTGTSAELDSLEIYWWDPDKSVWTSMSCRKSKLLEPVLDSELLTTQPIEGASVDLFHFSRYAGGKAGW
jgi:hypothetical protein